MIMLKISNHAVHITTYVGELKIFEAPCPVILKDPKGFFIFDDFCA